MSEHETATTRYAWWVAWLLGVVMVGVVAHPSLGQSPEPGFGDPMVGLLPAEFERFRIGLEDFLEVETAEEGLGPAYNGTSCAGCHSVPAVGGVGLVSEVRAAFRDSQGNVRPLSTPDGVPLDTLFHLFSVPAHGCQPEIPPEANVIARRIPIPTFGAGLVEAIPDETLLSLADPDDVNADGISGRAAMVLDVSTGSQRVGRFGWKSQHATLRAFSADAYRNEMGITNELFPDELAVGVSPEAMRLCDPLPDPEDLPDPRTRLAAIDNFEAFMKFLAPPSRGSTDSTVAAGERVFSEAGCDLCHVPTLQTGPSTHPLFDRRTVPLFSDLLLHDVATGDSIPQGSAMPEEIRTPALWGLRVRRPLLHDGRASTVEDAVLSHGREAETARTRFERLAPVDRIALLAFLNSL